MMRRCSCASSV